MNRLRKRCLDFSKRYVATSTTVSSVLLAVAALCGVRCCSNGIRNVVSSDLAWTHQAFIPCLWMARMCEVSSTFGVSGRCCCRAVGTGKEHPHAFRRIPPAAARALSSFRRRRRTSTRRSRIIQPRRAGQSRGCLLRNQRGWPCCTVLLISSCIRECRKPWPCHTRSAGAAFCYWHSRQLHGSDCPQRPNVLGGSKHSESAG